jgi:hypothetical protein
MPWMLRRADGSPASDRRFRARHAAASHASKIAHAEADRLLQAVTIEVWWVNDAGTPKMLEGFYTAPAPSY